MLTIVDTWVALCDRLTDLVGRLGRLGCPHTASEPFWRQGRPMTRCVACGHIQGRYERTLR